MELGNFSVSLAVKDLAASRCFYEQLGFVSTMGDFARERGARALEAYPIITDPGQDVTWGELHVGSRGIFGNAGFEQVSHPTLRRVVMRIDF